MNAHASPTPENKNRSAANEAPQKQSGGESSFQFQDNRPEALQTQTLQETANASPQAKQLKALQKIANAGTPSVAQRVSIVVGYKDNDPMFTGALDDLAAPNPIHTFNETGAPETNAHIETLKERLKEKPSDPSTLHLIAHGSPGSVAKLDLDTFLNELKTAGHFTDQTTAVHLYSCFAMMREQGLENKSAALKVAEWIQANIGDQPMRAVNLKTGYTSNTTGEYAKGNPSYKPLDIRGILEGHNLQLYFYYMMKDKLEEAGQGEEWPSIRRKERFRNDLSFAEADLTEEIIAMNPGREWGKGTLTMAKNFQITGASIEKEYQLHGYTVASVNEGNYKTFPERLVFYNNLGADGPAILEAFNKYVQQIFKEHKPKPVVASGFQGFSFGGSSTGGFTFGMGGNTGGFTFGFGSNTGGSSSSGGQEKKEE